MVRVLFREQFLQGLEPHTLTGVWITLLSVDEAAFNHGAGVTGVTRS
jgi:hypothetical protein